MNFSNAGQSTLLSAALAGDTTITVVDATRFPAAPFHVVVDQELMTVTAVAGTTFTVTRGIEGTTAAAHAAGATVTNTVTAADFAGFGGASSPLTTKGDLWGYDTGNNRVPVGSDGLVLTADSTQALGVKWSGPVFASARASSAQSVANGSQTVITLGTVIDDPLSWYAANGFTVTLAGIYIVESAILWQPTVGGVTARAENSIQVNGSTFIGFQDSFSNTYSALTVSVVVRLAANDTVKIVAFQASGNALSTYDDAATHSTLSLVRIGP